MCRRPSNRSRLDGTNARALPVSTHAIEGADGPSSGAGRRPGRSSAPTTRGKNRSMVPDRNVDPSLLYEDERRAFVARLRLAPIEQLSVTVAATPAWSVGDVLAHVVGIAADLNARRFGEGD